MKTYSIYIGRRLALKFQCPSPTAANERFDEFTPGHPDARTITLYEGKRDMANMCVQLRTGKVGA